jgi:hypothetical protein
MLIFRKCQHWSCPKRRRLPSVRLRIVTPSPAPPEGEGWLHEGKHDGHRLVGIVEIVTASG